MTPLPFDSLPGAYESQAGTLLEAWKAGDPQAIRLFHQKHPRFLDSRIPWLPKNLSDAEIRDARLDMDDARLALARWYDFRGWPELQEYAGAVTEAGSPVARFEKAVEAVIAGDLAALQSSLQEDPALVRARSTRVTHFDPPVHGATLLHYIAANGVEGYRQKSPGNAVAVARMLMEAGADPNALAGMYGGRHAALSMLVSSTPPAQAGVQVALVETLADYGASLEASGAGDWAGPLLTALAFGFRDAAEALARRGARLETLAAAAGLGRLEQARSLLDSSGPEDRHRALALAAQHGHVEIVRLLLDAGEDPNRYNPKGNHDHSTPLHQAIWAGHLEVVRLLIQRGARLDIRDTIYGGTPLGWAEYGGRKEIENYLRELTCSARPETPPERSPL